MVLSRLPILYGRTAVLLQAVGRKQWDKATARERKGLAAIFTIDRFLKYSRELRWEEHVLEDNSSLAFCTRRIRNQTGWLLQEPKNRLITRRALRFVRGARAIYIVNGRGEATPAIFLPTNDHNHDGLPQRFSRAAMRSLRAARNNVEPAAATLELAAA